MSNASRHSFFRVLGILAICTAAAGCLEGRLFPGYDVNNPTNQIIPPGSGGNFTAAAHPGPLQVVNSGGAVLTQPKLRIVTFNNDPQAAQLEDFGAKLAASSYWKTATSEYGVGALTVGAPFRATTTFNPAITDGELAAGQPSDIETFLLSQLDVATPPWG